MDDLPRLPIRPYGPLLLVMRDSPFKKRGLLFVPDTAQEAKRSGIVLATGRGTFRDEGPQKGTIREHELRRGDWVFWPQFAETGLQALEPFEVWTGTGGEREKREVLFVHEQTIFGTERDSKLVALGDCVIVARKKPDEQTAGGIIIPDVAQKQTNEGYVFAQGPGPWGDDEVNRLPMRTKVGEYVYWQDYAPSKHEALDRFAPEGHELVIIRRNEPMCVKEHV